ncbi:TPA: 4Fe-4S ferredoxin [bacterium]|nr:4Fe-4S ferredoxin [bacterium]
MRRNIIKIDEEKCNGCGQCVTACAEGAIAIVDGKAKLVSEIYCDGLGACIGECPEGALTIEERDAEAFDEEAVEEHLKELNSEEKELACGCPGTMARRIEREKKGKYDEINIQSELTNWPIQLKLVSPNAPALKNADILLTADCVPFALADFHPRFVQGRTVLIGCPKLDDAGYYVEKMTEIIKTAKPKSLTVVHMEVPCCSGLSIIAERAIMASKSNIPVQDVTIGISGEVLESVEVA